ncbi:hypothetical protein M885DRAFT_531013 [Pelagophyceae sp. CCMP2097]|nr:hypothetical protein M885DRAFT_531013 [Pelagophyceae sp. CCMP2097]
MPARALVLLNAVLTAPLVCGLGLPDRALALRMALMPKRKGKPAQFAAAVIGGRVLTDPTSEDRRAWMGTRPEPRDDILRRLKTEEPHLSGDILVVRLPVEATASREASSHCESLLIEHLRAVESFDAASILLYTLMCPCPDCATTIASFARQRPHLKVEVAYELSYIPDAYAQFNPGRTDSSSLENMRQAGIDCVRVEAPGEARSGEIADAS